jgi:hypothetical protein
VSTARHHSGRPACIDDGPGDRFDPDEAILDGSDYRQILGGGAMELALLLVKNHSVEIATLSPTAMVRPSRRPGRFRQLGGDALADIIVAGGRGGLFVERAF